MKINPFELQSALKGVGYSATNGDLVKAVQKNGGSDEITAAIGKLPEGPYDRSSDVTVKVDFGGETS